MKKEPKHMSKTFTVLSYVLFFTPFILIFNFLFNIVPLEKIQGMPVFLPLLFCPIGIFFALRAYTTRKRAISFIGAIANGLLFLFPIMYMIIGTALFGV